MWVKCLSGAHLLGGCDRRAAAGREGGASGEEAIDGTASIAYPRMQWAVDVGQEAGWHRAHR
jgi:hypothetical protein